MLVFHTVENPSPGDRGQRTLARASSFAAIRGSLAIPPSNALRDEEFVELRSDCESSRIARSQELEIANRHSGLDTAGWQPDDGETTEIVKERWG